MTEQDLSADSRGSIDLGRRQLIAGLGGLVVGGGAGTAYVLTQGGPRTVDLQKPNDNDEASLGEFYWLLENHGLEKGRITVEEMLYYSGPDRIELTYRSDAREKPEDQRLSHHFAEVGHVINEFAFYVNRDGRNGPAKGKTLDVNLNNTFPEQFTDYHVERKWVEKLNEKEWSKQRVFSMVLGTRSGGKAASGNSLGGNASDGNATDENTTGGNATTT